ncbi:hypothetical protein M0805_005807 [Coniferiporia weirii]|nr:hypothetical protein M0805_005807 [Coniferiporia weirii]
MPSYLVTGAARGIGHEFVRQLSSASDNLVFALVRSKKTADKLVKLARPNIHIVEADITDLKALKVGAQEVSKITGGKLDVLINNAAFVETERRKFHLDEYPKDQEEFLEEDLRKSFDINVIGVIHTINAFLPLLRAGEVKKVVSLSSGIGDLEGTLAMGYSYSAPYCISKAALNMAVAKYAMEYKKEGFVFLALSPGLVNTAAAISETPSEEEIAQVQAMMNDFRRAYPDFTGPITPEQSVNAMLDVIGKATVEGTGSFISHKGNKEWL